MKQIIVQMLQKHLPLSSSQIELLIQVPQDKNHGEYTFPCFTLAKKLKRNPAEIAKDITSKIKPAKEFEKVEFLGPYINFFINRNILALETLRKIAREKDKYGCSLLGKGKTIVIDMSSPNIAKPFGIGHLRSTIIGNAISNIAKFQGHKVVKINYLGDWGTQFGKLIVGYRRFGDPKKLKSDSIKHLLEIYVRVNKNEELEEEAREWFKKLESGDKSALLLWKKFKELSLKEFSNLYNELGISFDVISGESEYNTKLQEVVDLLREKGLLEESEGALVVNLEKYGLGVCLIQKKDGATLYATRDIAAALDRYHKYKFSSMLYEVGSEQKLHFQQFFKVLELLGCTWARNCNHIDHGLYLDKDGKKFATREGKTVFMEDILKETKDLARKEILSREKIPSRELEKRVSAIALASIFYGDLKNYRSQNMMFDIQRFVSFEGDTGPYLLYSYARAKSILAKAKNKKQGPKTNVKITESEKQLISSFAQFPEVVQQAHKDYAPNHIANYAYHLSQTFNEFYHQEKVIGSDNEQFRLALVSAFAQVLKNTLHLLGISPIEKM